MPAIRSLLLLVCLLLVSVGVHAQASPDTRPWPRSFDVQGQHLVLHQPQLESWVGNQLKGRLAVAVKTGENVGSDGKKRDVLTYGVMWFTARTDTDKVKRQVTLGNITVDKVSFPTDPGRQASYRQLLSGIAASKTQIVDLDALEAALAINKAMSVASVAVKNDPPDIVFSFEPALLVLIDGAPVLKPSGAAGVQRVVNTRSLILQRSGRYVINVAGRWLQADTLAGPWQILAKADGSLETAKAAAVKDKLVDVLDQPDETLAKAFAAGKPPAVIVASKPTELIVVDGEPQFADLSGTSLSYVANTPADVFVDKAHDQAWYVLISGRWFTANSSKGPWTYVPGKNLPADFVKIGTDSAKSAVLASIPGTPEARESLIANAIPQTATVDGKQAVLHLSYDGTPQFKPVDGTALRYAWNTAVPVIEVSGNSYYALQNGVWFTGASANGPWSVALEVPAAIYGIPASSPLHYVTYVSVYGHSGDQVYVGYTPGYYGTVASDGVVVYGTGYTCNAWIGDAWYGCPATYGFGVAFGYDPWVGWSFGFAWGWAYASAWYGPWWGPWGYAGGYYPGYWGGGIATANVYGRWGNRVVVGATVAWANPWTGNYGQAGRGGYYNEATGGRGAGYASRNTNIYTGTTSGQAGGVRYNPQTGRAVMGQGAAAYNPYTGNAVAGGSRTTLNTNTGRVTEHAGVAGSTDQRAGAAGAFNSQGAGGDARGAGYVNVDKATGQVTRAGVVQVNDQVYAGKDGNIYRYDKGEGWQQATPAGDFKAARPDAADVDADRMARDRGADRDYSRSTPTRATTQPSFERSNYGGRYQGNMGGFRPAAGGGRFGGGGRRR